MAKNNLRLLFAQMFKSSFLKDVRSVFLSFIVKIVVQGLYFVILVRIFKPDEYGAFVGIIAIISLFYPFASLGSNWLLVKNVSKDQSVFADYWGTGILKNLIIGSLFITIILLLLNLNPIPNISNFSVFLLSLANLIFLPLSDFNRDTFIAVGRLNYLGKIIILLPANRCLAALALATLFEKPSLLTWSVLYTMATLATAIISSILAFKLVGHPKFKLSRITQELSQGFAFSVGASAESVYGELDKFMLVRLAPVEAAGIYGAAVQIFSVSLTPIQAVMLAAYRKFFQEGNAGISGGLKLCKKLLPATIGYSLLGIAFIFLFAPSLPKLIGYQYSDSAFALMWFSPLILIRAMHSVAGDVLTGANYQRIRSAIQILTAFMNALLNFWLIPLYQWHGAIWATIASEAFLMCSLWVSICVLKEDQV